jgi:threonine dehydrogenase-like Zn-dependent dehydrogenase
MAMRAAVLRGGVVQARDVDDPVPGLGQVLVRSLACGICASDLHYMDHPEAGADDDSGMSTYDTGIDIIMGHEFCAEVVSYGPGTERRVPVGTRVSSLPILAIPGGRKIIGQNPESPGCVVFECVGIPGVLDSVIKAGGHGTRIFSMGGPPEGELLHTLTAKRKGINIQFGGGPSMAYWDEAFEAVCSGRLDVRPMLGRTVGLGEVPEALDAARDANGPARIIVVP